VENRSLNPSPYGGTDARSVCLARNQFAVWRSLWGQTVTSKVTVHDDYAYCEGLATKIAAGTQPTAQDPTGGKTNFRTKIASSETDHPGGVEIGGNWFF
jgi:hypothetical protein